MKRFILIVAVLSCTTLLMAGSLDKVVAKITSASLTATKSYDNTTKVTGWLERIDCTFGGTSQTVALVVFASNEVNGITRTLLDIASTATDASYTPRFAPQTTAGATSIGFTNCSQRFMMLNETIYLTTTNAAYSNQTVTAIVFYERP